MKQAFTTFRPVTVVAVAIFFAVSAIAQNGSLRSDVQANFSNFEIADISVNGSRMNVRGPRSNIEIILTPHDMRASRYRAEVTGVDGRTSVDRGEVTTFVGSTSGGGVRVNKVTRGYEGFFEQNGERFFFESASSYSTMATAKDYVIYRMQDARREDTVGCSSHLVRKLEAGREMAGINALVPRRIELAIDADLEYINTLGGIAPATNEILGILNTVEGLYQNELALTISVVYQHSWTTADPYSGVNAEGMTRSFQAYWNVNFPHSAIPRDTAHLFSGKQNVQSQGWAFIGAVCSNPTFAYGMSGYISWAPGKHLLTGHEIAHNLGANHVDTPQSCGSTMMNLQLSGSTPLTFCQYSRDEIGNYIAATSCLTSPTACKFDFDEDAKADVSIFRPLQGEWWVSRSSNGSNGAAQFGSSTDKIVPTDFTGDGKTDIAIFRPANGNWFVLRSEDSTYFAFPFGTNGDVPVPADFDNDGKSDAAIFRPSTSTWYIGRSTGGTTISQFGIAGDVPIPADYDGDGNTDVAIFRPSTATWWLSRSSAGTVAFQFGTATDKPVPGDYTGDGKADVAVFTSSTGVWSVLRSEDASFFAFPFGTVGDIPSPADYDGDGKFDAGVFRPSNSTWFIQRSTAGTLIQQFGIAGDIPIPNAFVR